MGMTTWRSGTFVHLTAADVAVGREKWMKLISAHATTEAARAVMEANRFDVLPIDDGAAVESYFRTRTWNDYKGIECKRIRGQDILPPDTPFREVLRGMALERRMFYFLADRDSILGLLSVANLNRRQVKVYLFGLLCDLEVELAEFVEARVSPQEIREFASKKTGDDSEATRETRRAVAKGVDEDPVHRLYLGDLVDMVRNRGPHLQLGYTDRNFKKTLDPIVRLRNVVAHPARPLIDSVGAVEDLWKRVLDMEDALFRHRHRS